MPLMDWLALMQSRVRADEFWVVDPFRLAASEAGWSRT